MPDVRKVIPIQFRDKNDIRPLPPIPEDLAKATMGLNDIFNANNLNPLEKLAAAYALVDRYNVFVATFAVCQRGCHYCCRVDVDVSPLEVDFITTNTGVRARPGTDWSHNHASLCPLLNADGTCSVYEYRPFNCRTFHALDDPKYCANKNESHQTYGAAAGGYGVGLYRAIARWLKGMHQVNNLQSRDIRDWFGGRK